MSRNDDFEMSDSVSSNGRGADDESRTPLYTNGSTRRRSVGVSREGHLDDGPMIAAEARLADRAFLRKSILISSLIASWYFFSISITVYNKWMFQDQKGEKVFPFPLFTTCVHMIVQFCLAGLVLYFVPSLRPTNGESHQRLDDSDPTKPIMTKHFYLTRIGPCGFATSLDIGLGNFSLRFITLTFYTMCKSSVLGFVLLFAFIFRLEKPSWKLGAIITAMTIGVFLMVAGETEFKLGGFLLVMTAAASSGLRWSLTQILLIKHPATSNPFSSIFFLAPIMFVTLFILALPVEGLGDMYHAFNKLGDKYGFLVAPLILLFPGCLAFLMTASEFALLQRTSVVTLSICGIFKEVLTISTAALVFGDQLTSVNGVGLVITILTIAAYNYFKITKLRQEARNEAHDAAVSASSASYAPVSSSDPDVEDAKVVPKRSFADSISGDRPAGILRHNLSVSTASSAMNRAVTDSPRASPVKRPEDIE